MQTANSETLEIGSRQSAVGSRVSLAALRVGNRVGGFELIEILERKSAVVYRFHGACGHFGIEWHYRAQPPTRDDLRFILGELSTADCRSS